MGSSTTSRRRAATTSRTPCVEHHAPTLHLPIGDAREARGQNPEVHTPPPEGRTMRGSAGAARWRCGQLPFFRPQNEVPSPHPPSGEQGLTSAGALRGRTLLLPAERQCCSAIACSSCCPGSAPSACPIAAGSGRAARSAYGPQPVALGKNVKWSDPLRRHYEHS